MPAQMDDVSNKIIQRYERFLFIKWGTEGVVKDLAILKLIMQHRRWKMQLPFLKQLRTLI